MLLQIMVLLITVKTVALGVEQPMLAAVGDPHSTAPKTGEPVDSEGAQK